ncbi:MAG TPA: response regulator transcription factor [Candidatus Limnocylindria bacterium]|nr:response regulator transcription factor [Candidatus Limnocylindria bacterium]
MRILLVEDEPRIVRLLERGLGAHGHQLIGAEDGEAGLALAEDETIDLAILDIGLPGMDGQEVLRRLRARRSDLPVLMLTARDDVDSKVQSLDAGADDYLTKPFAFEELMARVRALTRRRDQQQAGVIQLGDVRIDLRSRRAWRGERELELAAREFALLEYFMRHPGQVLTRTQILEAVWDYDYDPGSNVVDVYVGYLRRKLRDEAGEAPISTLRGAGYRYEAPAS